MHDSPLVTVEAPHKHSFPVTEFRFRTGCVRGVRESYIDEKHLVACWKGLEV